LTGERPFQGDTQLLVHQVLFDEPRPPRQRDRRVPRELETICLKAMEKAPERRYATAQEMAADLHRYLRGEPITAKLTRAPGNNAAIGGLKVTARSGWFAARPSGTENIYKIYAESFISQAHLNEIVGEAQAMVNRALQSA